MYIYIYIYSWGVPTIMGRVLVMSINGIIIGWGQFWGILFWKLPCRKLNRCMRISVISVSFLLRKSAI